MRAVAYRLRCVFRERWLANVGLCVVVAVVTGVVLAFAAGAERTATVADRYTSANAVFDGSIYQNDGRPRTKEVAALPGTASAHSITFVFGLLIPTGASESIDSSDFSGSYLATGVRLVAGRDVDPAIAGEFVASRSFIDAYHARIGDTFTLKTLSQKQADARGYDTQEAPAGPSMKAVLVGVVDGPAGLDDPTPAAFFSPALLDDPRIGVKVTIMVVRLRTGVDLDAFRTQLNTLPDSEALSLDKAVLVSPELRKAAKAQALGLWALAAVAAIASIAVLGQLITRHVRLSDADRNRLMSIGYGDRQMVWESIGRAAIPAVSGTAIGLVLATSLSGIFPRGFARRLEPHVGLRVDVGVLLPGAVIFIVTLLACTLAALLLSRLTSRQGSSTTSRIEAVASRAGSATASTGLRFAFGRRDQDPGSTRTVVVGLALTLAFLVGALTFATSLVRLVDQPARYGVNYDMMLGSGATSIPDEMRAALDSDADIDGLVLYAEGQVSYGSATLRLIGMQALKGDIAPRVLLGRLPASNDEIALGRLAANALHARVGGSVSLSGDNGTGQFHVTGLVVVPSIGLNDGIGQDGLLTLAGLARLNPTAPVTAVAVGFRSDAPPGAVQRLAQLTGAGAALSNDTSTSSTLPPAIVNIDRISSIPFVLAAMLAVLAVVTVGYAMVTAVHNRRRDMAILRSIGADRRWIARAVHWQASAFTLLPLAIGVPLGLIVGRIVFRSFADSIGTVDDASLPLLLVTVVVVGLMVIANVVASVPAHRADRLAPALLLRSE
ncbi:MAG: ABC transporter permease [Ilumatobacteraceae bacterium]